MKDLPSENYLTNLFQFTNDLIHILDMEGRIQKVNPSWLKNLGYTFEEVKNKSIYEFIDVNDHDLHKAYRKDVINGINTGLIELTLISKNKLKIPVEGQVNNIFSESGIFYTQAILRNITDKKETEKRNLEIQNRLTRFFQYAPDAVIVIDENQMITEWNLKAEITFGYTYQEVYQQPLNELIIPPAYRAAHIQGMKHFLASGEGPVLNKTIEITAIRKDGKEFPVSLSISNIQIDNKWLFIAFISDISERKNMEESLILKQAELLQSQLMDKRKTDFLTVASHELKTPLTSIKAYTQVALNIVKKRSDEQLMSFLSKIDNQSSKLNHLIAELTDLSRIDLGRMDINKTKVKLSTFIADVVSSLQPIIQQHTIELKNIVSIELEIDLIRIEQVLINLISNAAKFSPVGKPIEISTALNNEFLIISVRDYGIGVPAKNQEKLFNRYYRVTEISNHVSGFGIGLYIASEIVKHHGGNINVQSELNQGSVFSFTIPVQQV
jgi:two-component system sensor kinase FixL